MSLPRALLRTGLAVGLVSSVLAVWPAGVAAAYDGEEGDCESISAGDTTHYETTRPSLPLETMEVAAASERARKLGRRPGAGVVVAVIDSGVAAGAPIPSAGHVDAGNKTAEPSDYHGTAVAGLIAGQPRPGGGGAVGIAPYAQIFDVQVYDDVDAAPDNPTASPMTPENLRLGLDQVIAAVPTLGIRIVNMSLVVPDDQGIRDRIAQLWSMGVVVVAPTGNRSDQVPDDIPSSYAEAHESGEDAAPWIHPADYDHVLGVNATPRGADNSDPTSYVLENSMTDVAAPTAMAVSYSLRGESCLLRVPATSFAAAEVSGVLALLQSAYDESIAASVRRLLTTANGRPDIPNTLVGAGEVQAYDALTRPMHPDEDGDDPGAGSIAHQPQVLSVPEEPDDVLASTRKDAVWWGLLGGGLLLLALVLRPVLARRRTSAR